jgi:hypothetical protein
MTPSDVRDEAFSRVSEVPISTCGEAFSDGTFIELTRRVGDSARLDLLLWDAHEQVVGATVRYHGRVYKPSSIPQTIVDELNLPWRIGAFASARDLVAKISNLFDEFVGLPEKFAALLGRFVLATWLVDAVQTAPRLLIEGPDTVRARQLFRLLRCLCRRALPLAGVSPASLCSLPNSMCFTLLIDWTNISATLSNLLGAATRRDSQILRGGELLDLYGAQIFLRDGEAGDSIRPVDAIQIPCMPSARQMPLLDRDAQQRIVEGIQPQLLAFRLANYRGAASTRVDCSNFAIQLRELAASLAAATPGDADLQTQLHRLLQEKDDQLRTAHWVDLNTVILESILVRCHEGKTGCVYVGELAEIAQKILERRGENRKIDPGEVGRRIKSLGFSAEPRDARGVKLRLSTGVCFRAHDLGHRFDVPAVRECRCRSVGSVGKSSEVAEESSAASPGNSLRRGAR